MTRDVPAPSRAYYPTPFVNGDFTLEDVDATMKLPLRTSSVADQAKPADRQQIPVQHTWVSTVGDRYCSPIATIRVGGELGGDNVSKTFYVHTDVIRRSPDFKKALEDSVKETGELALDLPHEDPTVVYFIITFLYENKFIPYNSDEVALIKAVDDFLSSHGKGKAENKTAPNGLAPKHAGVTPWSPRYQSTDVINVMDDMPMTSYSLNHPAFPKLTADITVWNKAFEIHISTYIASRRYHIDELSDLVCYSAVQMVEHAGTAAATPALLGMCCHLTQHVPEQDELLKMLLARVGFLQTHLWEKFPNDTAAFFKAYPEFSTKVLRETMARQSLTGSDVLPSLDMHEEAYLRWNSPKRASMYSSIPLSGGRCYTPYARGQRISTVRKRSSGPAIHDDQYGPTGELKPTVSWRRPGSPTAAAWAGRPARQGNPKCEAAKQQQKLAEEMRDMAEMENQVKAEIERLKVQYNAGLNRE